MPLLRGVGHVVMQGGEKDRHSERQQIWDMGLWQMLDQLPNGKIDEPDEVNCNPPIMVVYPSATPSATVPHHIALCTGSALAPSLAATSASAPDAQGGANHRSAGALCDDKKDVLRWVKRGKNYFLCHG